MLKGSIVISHSNKRSYLLILGKRVGVEDHFVDLDVVEGSIVAVDWLSLHQIQGFESIDHLHKRSSTLPNTVYCLFSFDSLL